MTIFHTVSLSLPTAVAVDAGGLHTKVGRDPTTADDNLWLLNSNCYLNGIPSGKFLAKVQAVHNRACWRATPWRFRPYRMRSDR